MKKSKILLIEDEEDIAELIKLQAEIAGYAVVIADNGLDGMLAVEREQPDIVISDIMLPGINGLDLCRKLKNNPKTQKIPIILISAKGDELDVVTGLELGADDYLPKPFSLKILLSRIRAVLRRGKEIQGGSESAITFGPFELDIEAYQLTKNGKSIPLTLSEINILHTLVTNRSRVLTRDQLLDATPNQDGDIVDRNIDVHIAALRRKLGPNFNGIETVRGIGYRFVD